ncbi:MAG: hypothetical protein [Circular genetic element sp.]|nr:MAG: hypothetical protein [Circular genetic element sp.]
MLTGLLRCAGRTQKGDVSTCASRIISARTASATSSTPESGTPGQLCMATRVPPGRSLASTWNTHTPESSTRPTRHTTSLASAGNSPGCSHASTVRLSFCLLCFIWPAAFCSATPSG